MQTTSSRLQTLAASDARLLSWILLISFDKAFDDSIVFFTLGESKYNSTDILSPDDSNVLTEWDKYKYVDFSDRVISIEWQREEDIPYSANLAIADITLNNYDRFFSPNSNSPIKDFILPRRPLRILGGFGGENIPQFVGLNDKSFVIDEVARTATIHCTDFLSFLFNKPLDNSVFFVDSRTDQILAQIFDDQGLSTDQYSLDVGFNKVGFVYFEKGTKIGEAINQIMEPEMGHVFMDETGIIRFKNRQVRSLSPVMSFDDSNTVSVRTSGNTKIINVVEVKANVRRVLPVSNVLVLSQDRMLPADQLLVKNSTTSKWFSFDDPVTAIDAITYFRANSKADGTGTDMTLNLSIAGYTLFTNTILVDFLNSNAVSDIYLVGLTITGTPAKVVEQVYYRAQDDESVDKYEEQVMTIENDLIQSEDSAKSLALTLLDYYNEADDAIEISVKGSPATQIGDCIEVTAEHLDNIYIVTKVENVVVDSRWRQILNARKSTARQFFILAESQYNGTDVLDA